MIAYCIITLRSKRGRSVKDAVEIKCMTVIKYKCVDAARLHYIAPKRPPKTAVRAVGGAKKILEHGTQSRLVRYVFISAIPI